MLLTLPDVVGQAHVVLVLVLVLVVVVVEPPIGPT